MPIFTIGHGTRPSEELVACLREVQVETLVDVRRFPASRRNPQFRRGALAGALAQAGAADPPGGRPAGRRPRLTSEAKNRFFAGSSSRERKVRPPRVV